MKCMNICSIENYQHNGTEKKKYYKVGELVEFDNGGSIIRLHMFPGQTFYVYEDKKNNNAVEF